MRCANVSECKALLERESIHEYDAEDDEQVEVEDVGDAQGEPQNDAQDT